MPVLFIVIGILSGLASGLFGIGGGVIVVPALAYLAGFSQERAVGTSLAVLLPPVGLAAVLQYWRHGDVDIKGAIWVAVGMFLGAWVGAVFSLQAGDARMKIGFGLFLVVLGLWILATAAKSPRVFGPMM